MRASRLSKLLMIGVVMTELSGCGNSADQYFGVPDEYGPERPVTIVEARRETVALELELYDYLDKQHGIANWEAPPPTSGMSQARESAFMRCPGETRSENWRLAISSVTPNDFPEPETKWKQITDGLSSLLTPRGFSQPQLQTMPNGDHIAVYFQPTTGERVKINFKTFTLITIDTGCARSKDPYDGWPEGTEAIPEHLRTTGRVYYGNYASRQPGDPFIEDWSPITPQTPIPAPPSASTTPSAEAPTAPESDHTPAF